MAALALALAACSGDPPEASLSREDGENKVTAVVVERPQVESLDDVFLERESTLLPVAEATISTRQEGFVRDLVPELGDILHEGDLIAEIDPTDRQLRLAELRAALNQAETGLHVEQGTWERFQKLYKRDVISEGQKDLQLAALERAKSEVAQARARVERAEEDLAQLHIVAPMPGVITQHFTETGEYLERGEAVTRLKRIDVIVALCTVNERFLNEVREGSPALVHVTAYPDRVFEGLVWKVVGDAVVESRSFPVKVLLQNPDLALKPGMSARVSFIRHLQNALLVPKDGVLDAGRSPHVLVVREGLAARLDVELGASIDERWHVRSGVTPADLVIVTGNEDLDPGASVKMVELPPPGRPTLPEPTQAERPGKADS